MKTKMLIVTGLVALALPARPATATLVTLTNWQNSTISTYFLSGETFTANSAQSTSSGDPLLDNRVITSPTGNGTVEVSTNAAGFFQDPAESLYQPYRVGTYAVDLAAWSGSASSTSNRVIATLGLFSTHTSPTSTIDLSLSNPNLLFGAKVENRQRGGQDTLTVMYRDTLGVLQSVTIATNQSTTLDTDPNILKFSTFSSRTANSAPYTLRLDVFTNDTLQVRLLGGGLNGTVLASFDTGLLNIQTNVSGFLGFKVEAFAQANSQVSRQAFDNFYVNAIPEPGILGLLSVVGLLALAWRRTHGS